MFINRINNSKNEIVKIKDDDIPPPPSTYGFGSTTAVAPTPSWNIPTPAPTYVNANTPSYLDSYQTQVNNNSLTSN